MLSKILKIPTTAVIWTNFSTSDEHSAPALVVLPELPHLHEVLLKELGGLADVRVLHLAGVAAELFRENLGRHLLVELAQGGVELDVLLQAGK